MRRTAICLLISLMAFVAMGQQSPQPSPTPTDIIERVMPSVAVVLVGTTVKKADGVGSAVVVRENGVLLTAHHVIEGAKFVQVRFKNGEVFDDVQLLGVDKRRDIAALKIPAVQLPALRVSPVAGAKPGDPIYVVSHPEALPWSASAGIVSAIRPADEVPGAGSGYRILQFTAPASPGSSGGVVVNGKGELIGIVVGSNEDGQNLNFAVPVESVMGLAEVSSAKTFGSGSGLEMPAKEQATQSVRTPPLDTRVVRDEPNPAQGNKQEAVPVSASSEDLAKSEILKSKDPDFILRNFRTMYVDADKAVYFKSHQMKAALGSNPEFAGLHVSIVDDRYVADVVLEVGYTFAWDYPFQLKHQNTSLVLLAGKGAGAFSGPAGAGSVAKNLVKLLKPYRTPPAQPTAPKKK